MGFMQQSINVQCTAYYFLLVLWFDFTNTHTNTAHTWANRLTPMKVYINSACYVHTTPVMYSVIEWIICQYQKSTGFHNVFVFFFFLISDLSKSHICWLDSRRLGSSHESKNIDRYIYGVKKHTTNHLSLWKI